MKRVLIIAGEHSGEMYGAKIVSSFRDMYGDCIEFIGSGGEKMEAAGVKLIENVRNLEAIGPIEAFKMLKNYISLYLKIKRMAKKEKLDGVILIDFPDFNLFISKMLHKKGIKVIYFISPTIWIWRYNRVKKMKKNVDLVLSIFPNEKKIFDREGIRSLFVGHPLKMEVDSTEKIDVSKLLRGNTGVLIALLPGSRKKEIELIMDELLAGVKRLKSLFPELFFVIPIANKNVSDLIENKIRSNDVSSFVFTTDKSSSLILKNSYMAIVKSGTSTLEATFAGVPFVIVYKTSKLTYFLGKILLDVKKVGMVNLIWGGDVVPELIQENLTARNIVKTFGTIYLDKTYFISIKKKLKEISEVFKNIDTFREVAKILNAEIKGCEEENL